MPRDQIPFLQNFIASTNILTGWAGSNQITSKNATTDPLGGTNAYRLVATAVDALHYVSPSAPTYVKGTRYTFSFVAKAGPGCDSAYMSTGSVINQPFTLNDASRDALTGISSLTAGETGAAGQIAWTKEILTTAGARSGWKRCFVSWLENGTSTNLRLGPVKGATGENFAGDATTTYIDVYCPQLNVGFGEFAICPTVGAAITTQGLREDLFPWRNGIASSEDLGSADWQSPSSTYRNSNIIADARGEMRATTIVPSVGAGSKYVTGAANYETVKTGEMIYGMVEMKATVSFPYIAVSYNGGGNVFWVNPTTQAAGTTTGFNVTITDLGGTWCRVEFTKAALTNENVGLAIWPCDADGSISGTGDASSKVYAIGRTQLCIGGQKPYIRTRYPVLNAAGRETVLSRDATNASQNLVNDCNVLSTWTKTNVTTLKVATDPFGVANNAHVVTADATNAGHYMAYPLPVRTPISGAQSIFVKKAGIWDYAWFWSGAVGYTYFNMNTGAFGLNPHGLMAVSYGNGWYRIITTAGYTYPPTVVGFSSANGVNSEAGNGTTTGGAVYLYQIVDANWEGDPTDTGGTAVTPGIRNKVI